MNRQRQAGFIRNYSNKRLPELQQEPSEFSYFRPKPHRDDTEEFSPYKIEQAGQPLQKAEPPRKPLQRPPLTVKGKETSGAASQEKLKAQGEQIHSKIQQRMAVYEERKEKSKERLQENIGSIRNKIEQLDIALQELKSSKSTEQIRLHAKIQQEIQAELSSSSSEENQEVVVNSIPSPKMSIERPVRNGYRPLHEKEEIHQQGAIRHSNERSNSYSQRENIITFNSRTSNRPPLEIRDYSSSDDDEERTEQKQEDQEIKNELEQDRHLPQRDREQELKPIQHQQTKMQRQAKGVYKNKGGVCFDIDTRQFTAPIPQPKEETRPKKAAKVDKRSEVLRRRETAKAYDRMTRKALFTAFN